MIDAQALRRLIEASIADPRREPEFLRALLDARLYLHLARRASGTPPHIIQFDRLDGLRVTPVFTTPERAHLAAGGVVDIGAMVGRELLIATRGHVLMLDPNDTHGTLYPEEVDALLAGRAVAAPVPFDGAGEVAAVACDPLGLEPIARRALAPVEAVESLTLGRTGPYGWLVIAAVPSAWAERAARALALGLQERGRPRAATVDFTTLDPEEALPGWYVAAGLRPFWSRPRATREH